MDIRTENGGFKITYRSSTKSYCNNVTIGEIYQFMEQVDQEIRTAEEKEDKLREEAHNMEDDWKQNCNN